MLSIFVWVLSLLLELIVPRLGLTSWRRSSDLRRGVPDIGITTSWRSYEKSKYTPSSRPD